MVVPDRGRLQDRCDRAGDRTRFSMLPNYRSSPSCGLVSDLSHPRGVNRSRIDSRIHYRQTVFAGTWWRRDRHPAVERVPRICSVENNCSVKYIITTFNNFSSSPSNGILRIIQVNQSLATLAFYGVEVNLVLFLTRVLQQDIAEAANTVSNWTGTVYIFSLLGAFLSDSYWGRYKTCAIFQAIFVIVSFTLPINFPLSWSSALVTIHTDSSWELGLFYISIYMVALGNGGYQANTATFGADQFDKEDPKEDYSKVAFFSYFYLALNIGELFSNTILAPIATATLSPVATPLSRISQVLVAATKKCSVWFPPGEDSANLFEPEGSKNGALKMLHTQGIKFLDMAAFVTTQDEEELKQSEYKNNLWRLCPISQVEEVKCILRLIPIWLCTIIYSVVFMQMASIFVEQGDTMNTQISTFRIPASSISCFNLLSMAVFIFLYRRVVDPAVHGVRNDSKWLTELQRMGIGLVIAVMAMVSAGIVEWYRLKYARRDCKQCQGSSTLCIMWSVPQYGLIGESEVFMYVGQLEFFNAQAPEGLKSFGSALCMTSISLGNYVSSLLVSIVMKIL
ncbi:hypothetical protein SASPL_132911 [Salvia splendens]|uniref:Solute carrier family 15 (Peptide/histidine transporter), member 3/4 n=1 Tax=Salvia splendens TaxID=180675 RepID=A0A8X8X2T9_SALSN|nr:hypothetical protein SASPL_132911 [Salvia splendens]